MAAGCRPEPGISVGLSISEMTEVRSSRVMRDDGAESPARSDGMIFSPELGRLDRDGGGSGGGGGRLQRRRRHPVCWQRISLLTGRRR
jgi:hypothetical protein